MTNIATVLFHLKEKEVTIDGDRFTIEKLKNKSGKSKFETVILVAMHQLFKDKKKK